MQEKAMRAIEDATKEILKEFRENYIRKFVYEGHKSNVRYHNDTKKPTYQFLNAWKWTEIKRATNSLVTELFYNPDMLGFDSSTFLHGSIYSRPNDVRETLMDILNKSGRSSSLWLSVSRNTPYWDRFLEDMFNGGKLERILTKHFKNLGFRKV
jgi:hypothetical protein